MTQRDFRVRALGEIAIRCVDLPAMVAFYRDVIGLEPLNDAESNPSLHHIALSLPWDEQDAVIAWYEHLGRDYDVEYFDWVGWRGVFTLDPDGNTVELVARDPGWINPSDTAREPPAR